MPASSEPSLDTATAPVAGSGTGRRGILANVSYSLISQLSSGLFTAVLTLYLVRALAPTEYGNFALAISVGALVTLPADFGLSSSTARFVAENLAHPRTVAAILADSLKVKLLVSGAACALLVALAGPIADAYHAPLTWPLRFVAVAVFGQNLMFLFERSLIASGRVATNVSVVFGESAIECSSSVLLVVLGAGVVGATAGRALGYLFGAVLGLWVGARTFGWPAAWRRRGRRSMAGRTIRYGAPLLIVEGSYALFSMIDVLLIGAYLGTKQAGLFSAPTRLLVLLLYFGDAVSNGVAPRMARVSGRSPDGLALSRGLRALMLFGSLMLAPLVVWARPIVDLVLGSNYHGSITTLQVMSLCVYLGGLVPLVSVSVNYLGVGRRRVPLVIGATLLNALIDVILIPRIGIVSGAIATAAAYAVMVTGHLMICARHVELPFARIAVTAARGLLAAAAMAVVLLLIGTDPSRPMLFAGCAAGTIAFVLVLGLTRELSRSNLQTAWAAARGRLLGRTPAT